MAAIGEVNMKVNVDVAMRPIPCGAKVLFANNIDGLVVAVCDRFGRLTYEVVWFDGRMRHSQWLEACEIELIEEPEVD